MSDLHAKVFTALQALPPPVDTDQILATAQSVITDGKKQNDFAAWLEIHGPELAARLNDAAPDAPAEETTPVEDLRAALIIATDAAPADAPWLPEAQKALDRTGGNPSRRPKT